MRVFTNSTTRKCTYTWHISKLNRRAFCMRMHPYACMRMHAYGLLKCHRGIYCEMFTFLTSIWIFWSWMMYIGRCVPQTRSLGYWCISTMKVSLLKPCCHLWQDSLSFCKSVHWRQDGGWMLLRPYISRTFFEQRKKASMIMFRY